MNAVTACTPPQMAVQFCGYTLTLQPIPFHTGLDRVDIIAWERRSYGPNPSLVVVYGVPDMQSVPPTLIDNDAVVQVPLAYVSVRSGQHTITDADITPIADDRIPAVVLETQTARLAT